jgi:diaminohydroxyphosphoribosylaminopyrimidine deaminase/5-amino-6-(5-phosphoribosylamino)uracil reductase
VHKTRSQVEVVLAGIKSVAHDDAMLNARGLRSAKQPLRVILDPYLDISLTSKLVESAEEFPAMIMYIKADESKIQALKDKGVQLKQSAGYKDELDLKAVMNTLYEMNLYSVLLETGNRLSESFWKAKLVDKCMIFYGNMILGGERSIFRHYDRHNMDRAVPLEKIKVKKLLDNVLVTGYPLL